MLQTWDKIIDKSICKSFMAAIWKNIDILAAEYHMTESGDVS